MPLEEREKKLIAALLALASRAERQLGTVARVQLVRAYLNLRQLVLQLGSAGIFRAYQWRVLRAQAPGLLAPLNDNFAEAITRELTVLEPRVRELAAGYVRRTAPAIPASAPPLLQRSQVLGRTIAAEFDRSLGTSPFIDRHLQELDKTVQAGLLAQKPTAEIADDVISTATRRGEEVATLRTGSMARRMLNRATNYVAGAVWEVVNKATTAVFQTAATTPPAPAPATPAAAPAGAPPQLRWMWSAVLDPATCPVCRPLDGEIRNNPSEFPRRPPVHPNCRCVILPRGFT